MPVEISTTECASEQSDVYRCFRKKGLHFIHMNTRSLLPKIDEICHIANETGAAVIGVTETWLDSSVSDAEIEIPGYIIQRKDRRRTGGGVCMYINKYLAFTPRMDLTNNINNIESIWVDILLPKTGPILIGVCYRPPKQMEFYELLEKLCDNGNSFVKYETVILGDFNTNVQHMSDVSPLLILLNTLCKYVG